MFRDAFRKGNSGADRMSFDGNQEQLFCVLQEQLRHARTLTPYLVATVITCACPRFEAHPPMAKHRFKRLIEERAWVELAFALLEFELPRWKLRRVVYENDEWCCSLSRQPGIPFELDDMAEAAHEALSLAVMSALVEARRMSLERSKVSTVPQIRSAQGRAICCDNFV
jgi:hypothetical protein